MSVLILSESISFQTGSTVVLHESAHDVISFEWKIKRVWKRSRLDRWKKEEKMEEKILRETSHFFFFQISVCETTMLNRPIVPWFRWTWINLLNDSEKRLIKFFKNEIWWNFKISRFPNLLFMLISLIVKYSGSNSRYFNYVNINISPKFQLKFNVVSNLLLFSYAKHDIPNVINRQHSP